MLAVSISQALPAPDVLAVIEQNMVTDPYTRDLRLQRAELVNFLGGAK